MVSCHFVHTFIDVWSNLLVVSGDICAFGVVNKLFYISGDVNVYESTVSADLVAVVHAGRDAKKLALQTLFTLHKGALML